MTEAFSGCFPFESKDAVTYLKSLVGLEYRDFDVDGNYIGCFEPMYLLWPDLPRYPLPDRKSRYFAFSYSKLLKNFNRVESLSELDLIVFQMGKGILHVGIYLGENNFLHVQRGGYFEIARLSRFSNKVVAYLNKK